MNRPCARVQGRVTALVQRALMAGAAYGVWGQAHRPGTGCLARGPFPADGEHCLRARAAAWVWLRPPQPRGPVFLPLLPRSARRRGEFTTVVSSSAGRAGNAANAGRPSDRRRQRRRRQQRDDSKDDDDDGDGVPPLEQGSSSEARYLAAARPASEGPTRQYCNRARRPAASPGEDGRREWYYSRVVRRWCGGRGERRTAVRASVAIPRAAVRQVRAAATGSPIWSSTRGPHHEPHHEPFRNSPIISKHAHRSTPSAACRSRGRTSSSFVASSRSTASSSTSPPSERRGNYLGTTLCDAKVSLEACYTKRSVPYLQKDCHQKSPWFWRSPLL